MIDTSSPTPVPAIDLPAWEIRLAREAELAAQVLPHNKDVLFDALAAAGIAVVVVVFDGYGDSGQIEDVQSRNDDLDIALPPDQIEIAVVEWGADEPQRIAVSVRDAVERLAYAFLAETHAGWENNDGAYGEFTFSVADRTISLDYNERMMTSESYGHQW